MEIQIRYIKLGSCGKWEESCIEKDNTIRLGYESPYHEDCLNGNWHKVEEHWLKERNGSKGVATRDLNQIKDFYKLTDSDIWITFYKRKMYWCKANKEVIQLEDDGSRIRKVIGHWSCEDLHKHKQLAIENIDGRITKVQGFRGTICGVKLPEYLLRKIKGEVQPEVESTKEVFIDLKSKIENLIKGLWWNDFELLVDLIFAKSGWQRISVLGKTEKDIDLDVFSPVTQKRAFVQVKSSTNSKQIDEYHKKFKQYDQYDEMYFVFHTCTDNPVPINNDKLHLWDISRVAELVIHAGLIDWIITKRS